jgi:hypothetical protein
MAQDGGVGVEGMRCRVMLSFLSVSVPGLRDTATFYLPTLFFRSNGYSNPNLR